MLQRYDSLLLLLMPSCQLAADKFTAMALDSAVAAVPSADDPISVVVAADLTASKVINTS